MGEQDFNSKPLASFEKEVAFGIAERRRIAECVSIRANTEVRPYNVEIYIVIHRKTTTLHHSHKKIWGLL